MIIVAAMIISIIKKYRINRIFLLFHFKAINIIHLQI